MQTRPLFRKKLGHPKEPKKAKFNFVQKKKKKNTIESILHVGFISIVFPVAFIFPEHLTNLYNYQLTTKTNFSPLLFSSPLLPSICSESCPMTHWVIPCLMVEIVGASSMVSLLPLRKLDHLELLLLQK